MHSSFLCLVFILWWVPISFKRTCEICFEVLFLTYFTSDMYGKDNCFILLNFWKPRPMENKYFLFLRMNKNRLTERPRRFVLWGVAFSVLFSYKEAAWRVWKLYSGFVLWWSHFALLINLIGMAFKKDGSWLVLWHPHCDRGSIGVVLEDPHMKIGLGGSEPNICDTNQWFKKEQERTITSFLAWDTENIKTRSHVHTMKKGASGKGGKNTAKYNST